MIMRILGGRLRRRLGGGATASALLAAGLLLPAVAPAQEEERAVAPARTSEKAARAAESGSTVSGIVRFDDTGQPVRRAAVMLFAGTNYSAARRTVTNRRGEFRFKGVAAGSYFVVADAPGLNSFSSGIQFSPLGVSRKWLGEGQPSVTVDGRNEARAEVRVRRGGAISGRVLYSDGAPSTAARVMLYRREGAASAPFFTDIFLTDDRGVYRVEGLPPGEYFVGVVEKYAGGERLLPRDFAGMGAGLAAAYHPAARSVREARAVQVTEGGEAEGVDITLREDDLRQVSGVVRWRHTGRPADQVIVMIQRKDDPAVVLSYTDLMRSVASPGEDKDSSLMRDMALVMFATSTTPHTDAGDDGSWAFEDVPGGTYVLTVTAPLPEKERPPDQDRESGPNAPPPSPDRRLVSQRVEVTVDEDDVGGVTVELTEGGRISGTVVAEDRAAPRVRILVAGEGANPMFNFPYYANPDGSFLLEGVPAGDVRLDVVPFPEGDHYVKSITAGGVDLMRNPLKVANGAEAGGVRITLARGRAALSGRTVLAGGDAPVGGAGVLLVPADESLWPLRGAHTFARSDAEGAFSVGAAPGDYLVFTWGPKDEPAQSIEEYVRSRLAAARPVTLRPGESRKADLPVNVSRPADERD